MVQHTIVNLPNIPKKYTSLLRWEITPWRTNSFFPPCMAPSWFKPRESCQQFLDKGLHWLYTQALPLREHPPGRFMQEMQACLWGGTADTLSRNPANSWANCYWPDLSKVNRRHGRYSSTLKILFAFLKNVKAMLSQLFLSLSHVSQNLSRVSQNTGGIVLNFFFLNNIISGAMLMTFQ